MRAKPARPYAFKAAPADGNKKRRNTPVVNAVKGRKAAVRIRVQEERAAREREAREAWLSKYDRGRRYRRDSNVEADT